MRGMKASSVGVMVGMAMGSALNYCGETSELVRINGVRTWMSWEEVSENTDGLVVGDIVEVIESCEECGDSDYWTYRFDGTVLMSVDRAYFEELERSSDMSMDVGKNAELPLQRVERGMVARKSDNAYVFARGDSGTMTRRMMKRGWNRAVRRVGRREIAAEMSRF